MSEILKPNYDEVRERIRDFWGVFGEKNFKIPKDYWRIGEKDYQEIRDFTINQSRRLAEKYPSSLLNPNLDGEQGLLAHIDRMTELLGKLWHYEEFRNLFPEGTSFSFLKFLALVHDYSRFIFNGPFPLVYVDWVGDALVEKRFFPGIPFEKYLHSIRYITGEKNPPDEKTTPLPYIFKALDSLGKPGRDSEKFLSYDYYKWLQKQIELGRFPIRVRKDGKIVEISAQDYKENDIGMIRKGLRLIEEIVGGEIGRVFG